MNEEKIDTAIKEFIESIPEQKHITLTDDEIKYITSGIKAYPSEINAIPVKSSEELIREILKKRDAVNELKKFINDSHQITENSCIENSDDIIIKKI